MGSLKARMTQRGGMPLRVLANGKIVFQRSQNFFLLYSCRRECDRILLQYLKRKGIPPKIGRVPEAVISQIDWKREGFGVVNQYTVTFTLG